MVNAINGMVINEVRLSAKSILLLNLSNAFFFAFVDSSERITVPIETTNIPKISSRILFEYWSELTVPSPAVAAIIEDTNTFI